MKAEVVRAPLRGRRGDGRVWDRQRERGWSRIGTASAGQRYDEEPQRPRGGLNEKHVPRYTVTMTYAKTALTLPPALPRFVRPRTAWTDGRDFA